MTVLMLLLVVLGQPSPPPERAVVDVSAFRLRHSVPLAAQAVLRVETDKRQYQVSEPVSARLTVSNASTRDVHCHCTLYPMNMEIQYRLPPEEFRTMELSAKRVVPHMSSMFRLRPGEKVSTGRPDGAFPAMADNPLLAFDFKKGAPPFDRPGTYELRVVYFDTARMPAGRLVSPPIRLDVVPPDQRDAHTAYTNEIAEVAQSQLGGGITEVAVRDAIDFVERFAASVYAKRVRATLRAYLRARLFKEGSVAREEASDADRRVYEMLTGYDDGPWWQ